MAVVNAVGRRKTSVARVYLKQGTGAIVINGKPLNIYFPSSIRQFVVEQPLTEANAIGQYDISVNVQGGGLTGQAEAVRMAIARVLVQLDADLKPALRAKGFMTRDPRMVERKKFGKKKARRSFQFSKR